FYTGGTRPYGYLALGELMVFVFFGLVATVGTTYVQIERTPEAAWYAGTGVGALACAILVVNNLRDIRGDSEVGKRTLAVVLGPDRTRGLYALLVLAAATAAIAVASVTTWRCLIGLAFVSVAARPVRTVLSKAEGRALIQVLQQTGLAQLVWAALIGLALVTS
ncbi:MAG: 1,4-dihydroxy-2-naphthoate octaprenyltransferase, partial [Nocardioides sp.]